jgi:hypothetical protein
MVSHLESGRWQQDERTRNAATMSDSARGGGSRRVSYARAQHTDAAATPPPRRPSTMRTAALPNHETQHMRTRAYTTRFSWSLWFPALCIKRNTTMSLFFYNCIGEYLAVVFLLFWNLFGFCSDVYHRANKSLSLLQPLYRLIGKKLF